MDANDERILRDTIPDRYRDCVSPIGAAQSYIADLEMALQGILDHDDAEECQECAIGQSDAWKHAKQVLSD